MATRRSRIASSKARLVFLLAALPFFLRLGQGAQLVIPFAFERAGDKTVIRIDEHKPPLCEIGVDLSALNGAAAQAIGFAVLRFNFFPDLQGQFDRGGRHLGGDQLANRFVDGGAGNGLAVRFAPERHGRGRRHTTLPACRAARHSGRGDAGRNGHRLRALAARAMPSRGGDARAASYPRPLASRILQVLLKLLPSDVAGMGIRDAGEPIVALALPKQLLSVDGPPIMPTAIDVGPGVARIVQRSDRRRYRQRLENRLILIAQARRKAEPLACGRP